MALLLLPPESAKAKGRKIQIKNKNTPNIIWIVYLLLLEKIKATMVMKKSTIHFRLGHNGKAER